MSSTRNPGRVAGLLYLLLCITAPLRLQYIPSVLIVQDNAVATAKNIAAHELLFRLGIVSDLVAGTVLIFLVLAFYRLFKAIDPYLAALVVIVGGVLPAVIDFLNGANDGAALLLVRGASFLSVFDRNQQIALAMLFLRFHHQVLLGAEILWGVWLFPLAILVYRSGFLPRFIGVWLIVNGCAYIVMSLTGLLLPGYEDTVGQVVFPALLGEIVLMIWLVIKGANPLALKAAASA